MKLLYRLGLSVIILTMCLLIYVFYLVILPLKPVTINNSPYPVLTPVVAAGQNLEFRTDYCSSVAATAQIVQYFLDDDGRIIILAPKTFTTKVGCTHNIVVVRVPDTIMAGTYTLHTATSYSLNPLHSVVVQAETQSFKVTR